MMQGVLYVLRIYLILHACSYAGRSVQSATYISCLICCNLLHTLSYIHFQSCLLYLSHCCGSAIGWTMTAILPTNLPGVCYKTMHCLSDIVFCRRLPTLASLT